MQKNILNNSNHTHTHTIIVISSLLASNFLFISLHEVFGLSVLQFAMLPIVSVGLLFGLLPGIICVFASLLIYSILWTSLLGHALDFSLTYEASLQIIILIFTGIVSGQIHNLLKAHQQTLDDLLQKEERYRQLIYNAQDILYQTDKNGLFTFFNPTIEQATGYTADELIGVHYKKLHDPRAYQHVKSLYQEQFKSKIPHIYLETPIQTRDGQLVWFGINSQLIIDQHGEVNGFQAIARNIDKRRQAEITLREQQTLLSAMINNSPNAILVKDQDGVIIVANELVAKRLRKKPEDLIGKKVRDLHPNAEEAQRFSEEDQEVMSTLQPKIIIEEQIASTDGQKIWAQTIKFPLVMQDTQKRYVIIISTDISTLKQAEKRTIELSVQQEKVQLLKTLISNFSHDLKTPLSVIKTNLYFLQHSDRPQEKAEKIESINNQINILAGLINDTLELSRLDQLTTLHFSLININEFITTISNQFDAPAKQKDITIVFDLTPSLEAIPISPSDFNRVITNLLENAIRYTPQHGIVHIKTRDANNTLIIEITDTGIGIHKEELPFIFDRFYRTDTAQMTHSDGSGLGLAIAKLIVEMHYGTITAKSTVGQGTTFHITLPKTHNH